MAVLHMYVFGSWTIAALGSAVKAPPGKCTNPPACWISPVPSAFVLIAGKSPASSGVLDGDVVAFADAVGATETLELGVRAGPDAIGWAPQAVRRTVAANTRPLTLGKRTVGERGFGRLAITRSAGSQCNGRVTWWSTQTRAIELY